MANEIAKAPFFLAAAGYAKAFAQLRQEKELTPLTFLAGLLLASVAAEEGDDAQLVADNSDAIRAALKACNLTLVEEGIDAVEEKMPLSASLKETLNTNSRNFPDFLNQLVGVVAPVAIADNKFAAIISYYLPDYVRMKDSSLIEGDAFAAAAFSAFENGAFRDYLGLTSFFSANQKFLKALIDIKFDGLSGQKHKLPSTESLVPDLENALRDQGDGPVARFISAVDCGLTTGVNIVSDRVTAYHEAGHAIVASVLRPEISINQILVKRELDYDGVTIPDANSPHFRLGRREDYLTELCVLLAGQAAQYMKFGRGYMDTGASSDIEKATKRAWQSIAYYGLDLDFGPVDLSIFKQPQGWLFDEAHKRLQAVMKEAAARTENILNENCIKLEAIATALIKTGEVDFEQFVTNLSTHGLERVPGTIRAQSIAITRSVTFAATAGSHQTPEGVVRFDVGDAIITGEGGDSWPIGRVALEKLYEPLGNLKTGEDGRYKKRQNVVLALALAEASRVDMSNGRGLLVGRAGDWIVDYGEGDMAIVSGERFAALYVPAK